MPFFPPVRRICAPALLLSAGLALAAPLAAQPRGGPQAGPREVGVIEAAVSEVPQSVTLPGRATAFETAAVRPRIGGVIDEITFRAGEHVEAGQPMFRLEIGSLDAALAAAEARVAGAQAALDGASATVTRYRQIEGRGVSVADLEAAEVALSAAEANLRGAEAEVQAARLERDRATIRAPIEGEATRPAVTVGALVTANQAEPLAMVTRLDPIYVDVAASSSRLTEARQQIAAGEIRALDPPEVSLTLDTGRRYEAEGRIVDAGAAVSTSTGTVEMRLQFPNPDHLLLPGQFLRVEMTFATIDAVLVPQRATSRLADGSLSAFVAREGRAVRVELTEAGVFNNAWAVTSGVEPGEAVIVDGLSNLRDGAEVIPVPVTLDERGVVVTDEPEGRPARPAPPVAAAAEAPVAEGLGERVRRFIGLAPGETFAEGAQRRWQRLMGLINGAEAQG
ncbi:efflux RND transporter periplasmic adaptor subunit [Paracoccus sp. S-4012]|uniref:efflux RND transporter periplasmic adaptor subunit n=1 Tax=Paracoccus sp. S-4012 TaxID=2665648 RepID=UPI0012AF8F5B|nr:efflux RND transporter periplasmic adaptor subunit [Paracoccus sp. S-4012]MRX50363.1 efflux RND transporter periplasmic adaptor subunit [Paracoccus sp. S-4012]